MSESSVVSRSRVHLPRHFGDVVSDKVSSAVGSWPFIIGQSIFLALWIIFNIVGLLGFRWDPAPFILLNLLLSFQAGFTAPIIMISQNRQAAKDHIRDDLEAQEVADILNNHQELLEINRNLLELQQQQMQILDAIRGQQQKKVRS